MNTEPTSTAISVSMPADDIALITMDLPETGANVLNHQLFSELDQTMEELARNRSLAGVILFSAKRSIFVAGADLKVIVANLDWADPEIIKFCEKGRAVMARFSRCPFVSVAAIHGACVGGGLELALWCDHRIASNHRRTVLGLPEVKLGLVPGWAGTARLPRISGLEVATDLVTSGRLVSANEAHEMNFVDEVVDQDELINASIAAIRSQQKSQSFIESRKSIMGCVPGFDVAQDDGIADKIQSTMLKFGTSIFENNEIFHYAPTVALEHMTRTATVDIKQAWDSESVAMSQVWGSAASRGLLNHFFLADRNKKSPGMVDMTLDVKPIAHVGIVGAGLMGKAIAANCLKSGLNVTLLDADRKALKNAAKQLRKKSSGKSQGELNTAEDYSQLKDVDLAIESVVETLDVKQLVLKKIEAAVADEVIIGSNTSAIPIEKLAQALEHPQRICGIHFCHPELMSLVEVVCGPETAEATLTSAVQFVQGLRKMPVAINDSPGFVVNRLLAAMLDESLRLFVNGVDVETIDLAMQGFGFMGGPFQIIDVIGVDTCMYAGRTMWESGLKCVSLSPILPRMVKENLLGRKTKEGFYQYADRNDPSGELSEKTASLIASYRNDEAKDNDLISKGIINRILAAMALEATRILDEEIVDDPRDIDLCVIHGFSFPQHQGGILFWADQVSWQHVKETLYQTSDDVPHLEPTDTLKDLANQKRKIYEPAN
ncbi:MAG: 3-hydroxyacyl-CoA dehydrogenase NAD-binding domain-containing protein [Planctomycetota bacterium]